ncbi:MAG: YgiT-type zinc finger protein [Desulfarculaceae bacterium]
MLCPSCGKEMKHYRADYQAREVGLDNVVVQDAEQWACKCGEQVVELPHGRLRSEVGRALLEKRSPLTGPEIRFLRKAMALKGVELARLMGVNEATLYRWESGDKPISAVSDRLLRLLYAARKDIKAKRLSERFAEIGPAPEQATPHVIAV